MTTTKVSADGIATLLPAVLLSMLVILQGLIFVKDGTAVSRTVAAVAALATIIFLRRLGRRALPAVAIFAALALANLIWHIRTNAEPFTPRLLYASVIYGYLAMTAVGLLSVVFRRAAARLMLSGMSLAVSMVIVDVVLERTTFWAPLTGPQWVSPGPHPVLEDAYSPNSSGRTIYPDNPRGYFVNSDSATRAWELRMHHAGSRARLSLSSGDSGVARVDIDRADVPVPWHVQLNYVGLGVKRGEGYSVSFRIRANRPRQVSYGVGQNHDPWQGLGWYREAGVTTEWATVRDEFTANQKDDDGRVIFDLGSEMTTVEIGPPTVTHISTGASALRGMPIQHYVEYRFNDRGCRGPDYPIPSPGGRRRILVLGDSYTLGVGVHEEDTFAARLEQLLNAGIGYRYDVINCGVSGYSTRQERLMYEVVGRDYRPDIVLVAMVFNDDLSFREEVERGYITKGKTDHLFPGWYLIRSMSAFLQRPVDDFRGAVAELLRLRDLTTATGTRLAVVIFRNSPLNSLNSRLWNTLRDAVSRGLAGTDVPWTDLGDALMAEHTESELVVHRVDSHPNEIAHAIAAETIAGFLEREGLLR